MLSFGAFAPGVMGLSQFSAVQVYLQRYPVRLNFFTLCTPTPFAGAGLAGATQRPSASGVI